MLGGNASPHLARDLSAIPSGSRAWTTRRRTSLSTICEFDGRGIRRLNNLCNLWIKFPASSAHPYSNRGARATFVRASSQREALPYFLQRVRRPYPDQQ